MREPKIEDENGYQILRREDGWVVFNDEGTIKDCLPSLDAAREHARSLPPNRPKAH